MVDEHVTLLSPSRDQSQLTQNRAEKTPNQIIRAVNRLFTWGNG